MIKKIFSMLRTYITHSPPQRFNKNVPTYNVIGMMLWALISGIAAYQTLGLGVTSLILAVGWWFRSDRRFWLLLLLGVCFVIGAARIKQEQTLADDHYWKVFNHKSIYGTFDIQITDPNCSTVFPENPALVDAQVLCFDHNTRLQGKIYLKLPPNSPKILLDEQLTVTGRLLFFKWPSPSIRVFEVSKDKIKESQHQLPGGFGDYLANNHIYAQLEAEQIIDHHRAANTSITAAMSRLRDKLLSIILSNVDAKYHPLLSGMLLGCRKNIDPITKENFLYSGTLHLISVSGLHVGIVALLLGVLFGFLNFKVRYFLIMAGCLFYVLLSGCNVASLRALMMIELWCWSRIYLRYIPPLNIIGATAFLMLLWKAGSIYDLGFLYTFLITAFLLKGSELLISWRREAPLEQDLFTPPAAIKTSYKLYKKYIFYLEDAVAVAFIAWLSGSMLGLFFQNILIPGTIICNLLLLPVLFGIFWVAVIKIILSFWGFAAILLGSTLDFLTMLLKLVIDFCAGYFDLTCSRAPSFYECIFFYVSLWIVFSPTQKKLYRYAAALLIVLIYVNLHIDWVKPNSVLFCRGNTFDTPPAIALYDPSKNLSILINANNFEGINELEHYFNRYNIHHIDYWVITSNNYDIIRSIKYLSPKILIKNVVITDNTPSKNSKFIKEISELHNRLKFNYMIKNHPEYPLELGNIEINCQNNLINIAYLPERLNINQNNELSLNGHNRITINKNDQYFTDWVIKNSNSPEVRIYEFR